MTPQLNGWLYTIGWTLVHFVWQGAAIAVVIAAALAACRRASAQARYAVACFGLAALLAAPAATAIMLRSSSATSPAVSASTSAAPTYGASSVPASRPAATQLFASTAVRASALVEPWLPLVVGIWFSSALLLLARFAVASRRVLRLRRLSLQAPLSRWQATGERLAERLRIRQGFRVVDSVLVDVPSVIGTVRPIVLLPIAALTSLTPDQIEALLAHELAHIRRRDYAVNIAQTVAEALLFFHPAVWWMSARIREAREHCCDDIAVDVCAEPVVYASALAEIASWRPRDVALSLGAADGALLARVRRILREPEADTVPVRPGSIALALAILVTAGAAVQLSSHEPPTSVESSSQRLVTLKTRNMAEEFMLRTTDHFQLFYQRDLDLHAERVGREAEAAYERISGDLRHNLAKPVPLFVLRNAAETQRIASTFDLSSSAVAEQGLQDHILLAVDQPADQWLGAITHELTHVFGFDILPSQSIATWIREGLAEYERGTWDPNDLVVLRDAVRSNAVPAMSRLQNDSGRTPRLVSSLGHAAFDFVESRHGKDGVRQFLFALRKSADTGADPFRAALLMDRDAFDRAFAAYLRQRFATAANQAPVASGSSGANLRVEGEVTAVRSAAAEGLACLELWVPVGNSGELQRWAIECATDTAQKVTEALTPGDHVVITGPLARGLTAHRLTLASLARPADGFTWPAEL
jgi:beta-lactamase regulating signal transducer with metallopeptidase domain